MRRAIALSTKRARHCIDAMLEDAVMHPIRHAFQLEDLMRKR